MLQYATPNVPRQPFQKPSVFGDAPSRPHSTVQHHGFEIARPSSTASHHSYEDIRQSTLNGSAGAGGSSSLSALAACASIAVPVARQGSAEGSTRSSTPCNNPTMATQPTQFSAPASTGANIAPVCQNCQTSTTPLWRRDESGSVLCNACGLFLKLHGRARPISLKTDVIKSRNRVKATGPKKRDSHGGDGVLHAQNGYPAAHPDIAHAGHHTHSQHHQHGMPMGMNGERHRVPSPGSGPNGDSHTGPHNPNIAPQHIFDTVTLPPDTFASPSLPQFSLRQPSPSASTLNGSSANHSENSHSYDALVEQNKHLSTRANELEVINGLYQGRVRELEAHEEEARRHTQSLHAELAAARARIAELEAETGSARKRVKTYSDAGDRSGNSTPAVDSGDGTSV
ncbi:hypothetical protein DOTSEDRAFT_69643 [Dothistroma septosporum NZE10]|uniref:GATA-type domain-containing protein n=1 Tax=Dothistroma septosporum (strain NZE10 / CBS 128990) TaxID=675120 RepID=N1PWI9_DOTSN|nr:hypothetical protein DOTSEDRAFT_69643 [Dothistroma septosporum NZE10]